jgi:hypothetical protein
MINRRVFMINACWPTLLAGAPQSVLPVPGKQAELQFGPELPIVNNLGIDMTIDAAVAGNTLFAIGGGMYGALFAADLSNPEKPKTIGKLPGLGHVRQIAVRNGIAYITSREDGMFVIDVGRPERPSLISHYDTIELATGLGISGNIAFVACRQCGVELIDISNPRHLAHLSTVRVGEAQSVASRNGYLYSGVWGTRELVVCDVRNPRRPLFAGRASLDGYGDGVALQGDFCYVATGHHSATEGTARPQPQDPAFGHGHGLEIFNVARPTEPRLISRIKTPPRYRLFMDMWGVKISGHYAYLADTYNGIFIIDVSDPEHPRFAGHRQLPNVQARGEGYVLTGETVPSPVGGLALGRDYVYVAGGYSDLHVVAARGLAAPLKPQPDAPPVIPPLESVRPDPRYRLYQPGGQVHEIVPWGNTEDGAPRFLVAAGNAGFHVVRILDDCQPVAQYATRGIAYGAAANGDTVYIAEGMSGLSIWQGRRGLKPVGRYTVEGQSVKQVVVDPRGRYAFLHVGLNRLQIVDVSDPETPKFVLEQAYLGLFYQRPITATIDSLGGLVNWGHDGLFLYDVSAVSPPKAPAYRYPFAVTARNGAVRYRDGWLATSAGKYFVLHPGEKRSPEEIGLIGLPDRELYGKPSLSGNTLFISDPYSGRVTALDISDLAKPKMLAELELPEHPGYLVEHNGQALVPGGYQGLLLWKYRNAG